MKIVFLDFDGVLNGSYYLYYRVIGKLLDHLPYFNPDCVARVNRLCDETGARIVVASTWRRERTLDELRELLHAQRIWKRLKIIDKTPDKSDSGREIGYAIRDWMSKRRVLPKQYVILSNGRIAKENDETMSDLVKVSIVTDPVEGFTFKDFKQAKILLSEWQRPAELPSYRR